MKRIVYAIAPSESLVSRSDVLEVLEDVAGMLSRTVSRPEARMPVYQKAVSTLPGLVDAIESCRKAEKEEKELTFAVDYDSIVATAASVYPEGASLFGDFIGIAVSCILSGESKTTMQDTMKLAMMVRKHLGAVTAVFHTIH